MPLPDKKLTKGDIAAMKAAKSANLPLGNASHPFTQFPKWLWDEGEGSKVAKELTETDWRVLGATAWCASNIAQTAYRAQGTLKRIAQLTLMDKASASRALAHLSALRIVSLGYVGNNLAVYVWFQERPVERTHRCHGYNQTKGRIRKNGKATEWPPESSTAKQPEPQREQQEEELEREATATAHPQGEQRPHPSGHLEAYRLRTVSGTANSQLAEASTEHPQKQLAGGSTAFPVVAPSEECWTGPNPPAAEDPEFLAHAQSLRKRNGHQQ